MCTIQHTKKTMLFYGMVYMYLCNNTKHVILFIVIMCVPSHFSRLFLSGISMNKNCYWLVLFYFTFFIQFDAFKMESWYKRRDQIDRVVAVASNGRHQATFYYFSESQQQQLKKRRALCGACCCYLYDVLCTAIVEMLLLLSLL